LSRRNQPAHPTGGPPTLSGRACAQCLTKRELGGGGVIDSFETGCKMILQVFNKISTPQGDVLMQWQKWLCAGVFFALCLVIQAEPEKNLLQINDKDVDKALATFLEISKLQEKVSAPERTLAQGAAIVQQIDAMMKKNYGETELFSQHLAAITQALVFLQSEELLQQMQAVSKKDMPATVVAMLKEQEINFRKTIQEQRQEISDKTIAIVKARRAEISKALGGENEAN